MQLILGVVVSCLVVYSNALYTSSDDVVELTASNFNSQVLQSDDLWLVEFYAPWCGHCQSLAPEWKKAATALKGIVKVGAVDMDVHRNVGAPYNVQGFPTIKIFGGNKNSPSDYNGARTAQSLTDTAMQQLRTLVSDRLRGGGGRRSGGGSGGSGGGRKQGNPADVVELTDSNFEDTVLNSKDMWLVEFFAPWCGHCKRLEPEWAAAATELKGKVKLGALDATVHTVMASRYGIQGFPTIKMFQNGEATEYDGGRTASDIVAWATDKSAENIPPPEIVQLVEEKNLKDACDEHQICVIAILPNILDCQSKCRNDYIATLKRLGEKYKKKQWGYVWAEAAAQPEVEDAFGIGGFGYPAMAALNARKMKFSLLKGSFSEDGINEFLRAISMGRGSTAPLKNAKLPSVKKTDAWDGQDGKLPEEEDIDLSDVVLDDLDTDKAKTEL